PAGWASPNGATTSSSDWWPTQTGSLANAHAAPDARRACNRRSAAISTSRCPNEAPWSCCVAWLLDGDQGVAGQGARRVGDPAAEGLQLTEDQLRLGGVHESARELQYLWQ